MEVTRRLKAIEVVETADGGKRYRYSPRSFPGKPHRPRGAERRGSIVHVAVDDGVMVKVKAAAAARGVSVSWLAYELICAGLGVPTGADGPWTATLANDDRGKKEN